jgi:thioredoxin reductase (NADPH)
MSATPLLDAVIVGAGPAGLTAATYLGRFHRRSVVIDAGASRARWIPQSHNIPGFPSGIGGPDLLKQLRAQALRYGASICAGTAKSLGQHEGHFVVGAGDDEWHARYVLLATGVEDRLPPLRGAEEAVLRSVMRVCPICDAFEATGKSIAVIGDGEHGDREAQFLRTYSDEVALIHVGDSRPPHADRALVMRGIEILTVALDHLEIEQDAVRVHLPGGHSRAFEVCYAALGCAIQNRLATSLGAELDAVGSLKVNAHQQTSVPGLYAAGDVVRGLNQVVIAAAEAAIAATDIHNQLRKCGL